MKIAGRILTLLFAVVIFGLAIVNLPLTLQAFEDGTAAGQGLVGVSSSLHNAYLTDEFWQKNQFININGLHARLSGRRELNDIVLMRNGMLGYAGNRRRSMNLQASGIAQFAQWLEGIGTDFLYVQIPHKMDLEGKMLPTGFEDKLHENATDLLNSLSAKNVSTLDLRSDICATIEQVNQYFYPTDHHWSASGAMKAFRLIMTKLQRMYPELDIVNNEAADTYNWDKHVQKDYFLGSQGKRVGTLYAGVDDLVWYTPQFATSMSMQIPKYQQFTAGTFQDAVMLMHYVEEAPDYFQLSPYNIYIGGDYPLVIHRNGHAPVDMKILIIKDSFTLPLQSFMSTVFTAVEVIDPRHYTEKTIADYIRQTDPDLVILSPNPSVLETAVYYSFDTPDINEYYELTPIYSAPVQVEAESDESYNFFTIPASLEANTLYQVTLDGLSVTDGKTAGVHLMLYNDREELFIDNHVIDLDYYHRTGDNTWYFRTNDASDSKLLLYAGVHGHTEGIGVACSNLTISKATSAYPEGYTPKAKSLISGIDVSVLPRDDAYNYQILTDSLESNTEYTLTLDSVSLDAGDAASTMLALFDSGLNELVAKQPVAIGSTSEESIIWTFRTASDPQGQLCLLLYSGMPGETNFVGVTYRNLSLVKNLISTMPADAVPQPVESDDASPAVEADHATNTSGLPENLSFTMSPRASYYHFDSFPLSLEPGATYTLTIDSLMLTDGAAEAIDVTLYVPETDDHLAATQFVLSQQEPFSWTFCAPERSQQCQLLVYAGVRGKTNGVGITVSGLTLTHTAAAPAGKVVYLQDIVIAPSEEDFHYESLDIALHPTTLYQFSVNQVVFQGGASDVLSVSVYDTSSKTHLCRSDLPLATNVTPACTWEFETPEGDSSTWRLLIYAGDRSNTSGVGVECRSLMLLQPETPALD